TGPAIWCSARLRATSIRPVPWREGFAWPRSRSWWRSARSTRTRCTCRASTSTASWSIRIRKSASSSAPCEQPERECGAMIGELDVLRIVSERLDRIGVSYMLTGSFALAWYATPRMTRDIDLVVAIRPLDVSRLIDVFVADFYVDEETARKAVASSRMFNLMHLESGIK